MRPVNTLSKYDTQQDVHDMAYLFTSAFIHCRGPNMFSVSLPVIVPKESLGTVVANNGFLSQGTGRCFVVSLFLALVLVRRSLCI